MCSPSEIYILDRFEEGVAVLIARDGRQLTAAGLGGREGDAFSLEDGLWVPRPEAEAARRARIGGKLARIFKKPPPRP